MCAESATRGSGDGSVGGEEVALRRQPADAVECGLPRCFPISLSLSLYIYMYVCIYSSPPPPLYK